MRSELPDVIVPRRAGAAGLSLEGEISPARVERLASTYDLVGPVSAELRFSAEGDRRVWVTGRAEVGANVQCQRCLANFGTLLAADIDVGFGAPLEDEAREVLEGIDDELGLAAFIEDELMLGAPMVHRHPAEQCGREEVLAGHVLPVDEPQQKTRRPFEQLGSLMAARESKSKTGD